MHRPLTASLMMGVMILLLVSVDAVAGAWRVEQDGSGDWLTIQPAVDAAASGDTIFIGPGWYQDDERVLLGFKWYRIMAYWDTPKDLVFIGSGTGVTTIGPSVFEELQPSVEAVIGIQSYDWTNEIQVSGISFVNLHGGVTNLGSIAVSNCRFDTGGEGIKLNSGVNTIDSCEFVELDMSVGAFNCTSAIISDCLFDNARPYFGDTVQGIVQGCTVLSGSLAHFYHSNGSVTGNDANCGDYGIGVWVTTASVVTLTDNHIRGGQANLVIDGGNTLVTATNNIFESPTTVNVIIESEASLFAHGNDIFRRAGNPFMVKTEGYGPSTTAVIDMSNNHWGDQSDEFSLSWRIYDSGEDPNIHMTVDYMPIEGAPVPTESTSWGSVKSIFR